MKNVNKLGKRRVIDSKKKIKISLKNPPSSGRPAHPHETVTWKSCGIVVARESKQGTHKKRKSFEEEAKK